MKLSGLKLRQMRKADEHLRQLQAEIQWLENKLKTVKKPKHRKDLERQIKEREYNLHLGDFLKKG